MPPAAAVRHIKLVGATAMRTDAMAGPGEQPKSDGATFRIFSNGRTLLDEPRADANWKPFSFDLTGLAGQTVVLRFETDPGPRSDASFDFALWGGRTLLLEGFAPKAVGSAVPPLPLDLRQIHPVQNGEVAPPSGFDGRVATEVGANDAVLTYTGADGTLQYQWTRPVTAADPPFGRWHLRATPHGATEFRNVPFAGGARVEWTQGAQFKCSHLKSESGDGVTCLSTYEVAGHAVTLRCAAKLIGKSLVLDVSCEEPLIVLLDAGQWGPVLHRRPVTVPYYSGQVYYLEQEHLFVNTILDWTKSSASYNDLTRSGYDPRTDGSRSPLHERMIFSAAWQADETLPNIPNPPSRYREHLAGKIVLDIWGGQFADIARKLETLHEFRVEQLHRHHP